ncbi:hypothetical protein GF373_15775, partial [bacterium]|nr:hypothetical protein [bacterium]
MKRYQQCNYLFSLMLFALLVSAPAVADLQFEESQIFKVGFRPSHITSGDMNGDGYIDLVIANMFSDSISIAYNNGQGGFDEISEIPYTQGKKHPTSVATGDLDGDGDLDIATSQIQEILNAQQPFQNVSMVLFYNNGDGSFDQVIFPFDGNPSMSLIRDVNGDGQNDLIIGDNGELSFEAQAVGQFEPGITIYTNAGNRMFDLHKNIVTNGSIVYLNYRDYNQDASMDLVAISQGQITINELFQVVIIDPFIHVFKGTADGLRDTPSFDIEISQD